MKRVFVLGFIVYIFIGKNATRTGVLTNYGHVPALFLFYKKAPLGAFFCLKIMIVKLVVGFYGGLTLYKV